MSTKEKLETISKDLFRKTYIYLNRDQRDQVFKVYLAKYAVKVM